MFGYWLLIFCVVRLVHSDAVSLVATEIESSCSHSQLKSHPSLGVLISCKENRTIEGLERKLCDIYIEILGPLCSSNSSLISTLINSTNGEKLLKKNDGQIQEVCNIFNKPLKVMGGPLMKNLQLLFEKERCYRSCQDQNFEVLPLCSYGAYLLNITYTIQSSGNVPGELKTADEKKNAVKHQNPENNIPSDSKDALVSPKDSTKAKGNPTLLTSPKRSDVPGSSEDANKLNEPADPVNKPETSNPKSKEQASSGNSNRTPEQSDSEKTNAGAKNSSEKRNITNVQPAPVKPDMANAQSSLANINDKDSTNNQGKNNAMNVETSNTSKTGVANITSTNVKKGKEKEEHLVQAKVDNQQNDESIDGEFALKDGKDAPNLSEEDQDFEMYPDKQSDEQIPSPGNSLSDTHSKDTVLAKVDSKHVENLKPIISEDDSAVIASNYQSENMDDGDSYFFPYFMFICAVIIGGYIVYHNKQRILALIVEGRKGKRDPRGRRPNSANYRKLDSTLEEAISSSCNKSTSQIIY